MESGRKNDLVTITMRTYIYLPFLIFGSCGSEHTDPPAPVTAATSVPARATTIGTIPVPDGFKRLPAATGSFLNWLRGIPLKENRTVYLYNGVPKRNQSAQYAVLDISTGNKDLQQCADVVMRLRAEYLYAQKRFDEISFMDYSKKWYSWKGKEDRSRFELYLQQVFGYCGSASLEKQLRPVADFSGIRPGDVLVQGGFPGHAVIVADMAQNDKGQKIFMLVQGYQPAQDMHVLVNPSDNSGSPWFEIPAGEELVTPEWVFQKRHLRTW